MDEIKPKDMNLDLLMGHIIDSNLLIAQIVHLLEKGGEESYDLEEILENAVHLLEKVVEIPYDLEEVFIGHPENVGEERQTESGVKWRWQRSEVYLGSPESKSDLPSLGDLLRKREEMLQELRKKILTHKIEPYIGKDERNFITNVAASLFDDTDILEERLRTEFNNKIDNIVERYRKLGFFYLKEKPRNLVIDRLKEAIKCYIQGFYQSCAIMCRAVLETAIKQKIKDNYGTVRDVTLGILLDDAKDFGVITEEDYKLGLQVKKIGDDTVHDSRRCSPEKSYESLTKTKILLNRLYR